jgi:hypothetical protein
MKTGQRAGSTDLSRGGSDPREFVIAQYPVPCDFLGRKRHAVGWGSVEHGAAHAPPEEGLDRLQGFVRCDWGPSLLNRAHDINHITLGDLVNASAIPSRPDLPAEHP